MNILFVLYSNMASNSAAHIDGLAKVMIGQGHSVIVAVPEYPTRSELYQNSKYMVHSYSEIESKLSLFPNNNPADIIHAWTPREIVRIFCEKYLLNHYAKLIIHLEDNEDELCRNQIGSTDWDLLFNELETNIQFPKHLSHPVYSYRFMKASQGVTVLIESLSRLVPPEIPKIVFWPSTDDNIYHPRSPNLNLRSDLGVRKNTIMICYHGNAHPLNYIEVRSLYLAVALLNREGVATRLIRMGKDYIDIELDNNEWFSDFVSKLGFLDDRMKLGEIIAEADVLVQPGKPGPFNDYRFPSKLPDFLASGKPVILPKTNIGLQMIHKIDAYILDNADGISIADAVKEIMTDGQLREVLSNGSRRFYERHLQWNKSTTSLLNFYSTV